MDDAAGLLAAVADTRPDLAIVDVRMPPTFTDEGVRAAVLIRAQQPEVAILVLSQYVEERYAADLIADGRGGLGYLLKDRVADVAEFLADVERVGAGGTVLDPEVVAQIVLRSRARTPSPRSPRARCLAHGAGPPNAAIAADLVVTEGGREARLRDLRQARPTARRVREPARARGARLPGRRVPRMTGTGTEITLTPAPRRATMTDTMTPPAGAEPAAPGADPPSDPHRRGGRTRPRRGRLPPPGVSSPWRASRARRRSSRSRRW